MSRFVLQSDWVVAFQENESIWCSFYETNKESIHGKINPTPHSNEFNSKLESKNELFVEKDGFETLFISPNDLFKSSGGPAEAYLDVSLNEGTVQKLMT